MKPRIMMISMKSNLRTMRYIGLLLMFIFCLTAQNMMAQRGKLFRSEERRVGKECRSRWSPYH